MTYEIVVKAIYMKSGEVRIWGDNPDYHYFATPGTNIKLGDIIWVEDVGVNFGYVIE